MGLLEVLQRPSTGLGDPAPLASHLDNSEEKTCFVPVYFCDLVKKSVSKQGPRCWRSDCFSATDFLAIFNSKSDKIYKLNRLSLSTGISPK